MKLEELDSDKRSNARLALSLEISLLDQSGKTINISASGVYFEVITNDLDAFAIGTTFPVKISALTTTPGFEERKVNLNGNGCIVRSDVKEVTNRGSRLCLALRFNNALDIIPNGM